MPKFEVFFGRRGGVLAVFAWFLAATPKSRRFFRRRGKLLGLLLKQFVVLPGNVYFRCT